MKDFLGHELKLDDPVVVVLPSQSSHGLRLGTIKSISPKRVTVEYEQLSQDYRTTVVVESHRVMKMPL